ncbi:class I tRNA ligase family protein, partial [Candidatus Bipolaricaulota bacterium]|nr:class I tRNA ligase family protein [Candidatus Bipolaricaulota bacterium]
SRTILTIRANLDAYNFNLASESLYAFIWHDFCDWYLELAKVRLAFKQDQAVKGILYHVLKEILKLMHPFVPFISEEIWQILGEEPVSLSIAAFPQPAASDSQAEEEMAAFQEVVSAVRTIRAELNVPQNARLKVLVRTFNPELSALLKRKSQALNALVGAEEWQIKEDISAPPGSARQVLTDAELFVPLTELIDINAECSRLRKELNQVKTELAKAMRNLTNPSFLKQAPREVVKKEHKKQEELLAKQERLQANLTALEE